MFYCFLFSWVPKHAVLISTHFKQLALGYVHFSPFKACYSTKLQVQSDIVFNSCLILPSSLTILHLLKVAKIMILWQYKLTFREKRYSHFGAVHVSALFSLEYLLPF